MLFKIDDDDEHQKLSSTDSQKYKLCNPCDYPYAKPKELPINTSKMLSSVEKTKNMQITEYNNNNNNNNFMMLNLFILNLIFFLY